MAVTFAVVCSVSTWRTISGSNSSVRPSGYVIF